MGSPQCYVLDVGLRLFPCASSTGKAFISVKHDVSENMQPMYHSLFLSVKSMALSYALTWPFETAAIFKKEDGS